MTEVIKEFIVEVFGNNAWLGIIIIAMIPIIELRGAIPFALSAAWGASKLSYVEAYFYSVLGATLPALIIIPLLIPFFNFLKKTKMFNKFVQVFDERFTKNSNKIKNDTKNETSQTKIRLKKFIGVVTFVAVPLPLTGAWTGSAVAAYLKMSFVDGIIAVLIGNIISGAIMTTLCTLLPQYVDTILYVFIALAVVVVLVTIIIALVKNKKVDKTSEPLDKNC